MAALLVAAAPAALIAAARSDAEQTKIDRLLEEVRSSPAAFVRNDKEYDGAAAAAHLTRKLFFAGGRVKTARDFVLELASRSSQSGRPYLIRFTGQPARPLGDWLLERLAALEAADRPAASPPPSPSPSRPPASRRGSQGAASARTGSARRAVGAERIQ